MPAWNRILIPKEKIEDLYLIKKLSIAQISRELNVSTAPVHRSLREYKIPIRKLSEACTRIYVSKEQLKIWYSNEKLSMFEIADKLGCSHSSIVLKFKKFGLKSRGNIGTARPIKLTQKGFKYLYYTKRLSLDKIAKMVHCSESGLERRFKHYNLTSRTSKNRACRYKKTDFSGDLIEKSYLIGFRLGDLNVMKIVSVTQVRCSSTIPAQIRLIKNLFSKYSTPQTRKYLDKKFHIPKTDIVCLVNRSFDFLLPKEDKIPKWIKSNKELFFSFLAGYSDAEGCFYIHKRKNKIPFGKFEVQTQQKNIIIQIWKNLQNYGVESPYPLISKRAGYIQSNGTKNNKDMWRVTIARKDSLWKLISSLEPYIKHQNKIKDIQKVKNNLELRKKNTNSPSPFHLVA